MHATICYSNLWVGCKVFTLTTNVRLLMVNLDNNSKNTFKEFNNWLPDIGNGSLETMNTNDGNEHSWITIPQKLLQMMEMKEIYAFTMNPGDPLHPL